MAVCRVVLALRPADSHCFAGHRVHCAKWPQKCRQQQQEFADSAVRLESITGRVVDLEQRLGFCPPITSSNFTPRVIGVVSSSVINHL